LPPIDTAFSPYYKWDVDFDPLTMDYFINNVIDLVTFRDDYLYTLTLLPVLMRDNSVHWATALSRINYSEGFVDYAMHGMAAPLFGGTDFAHHIKHCYDRNTTAFFYVDSNERSRGISNTLFKIEWATDDTKQTPLLPYHSREIWRRYSPRRPFISYADDYVILNYIYENAYVLGYIRYSDHTMQFNEVVKYNFIVDENELITGRIPIYASGNEYGIYFQIITLDNGHLDFDGVSTLYFYYFETGKYAPVISLSDNITYINGRNSILVYNYYSIDNPNVMTGRIVFLGDYESVIIPHVTPVNDIISSRIEDDFIFIISWDYAILYNLLTQSFHYLNITTLSNGLRSNIRMFENQFGWLCFDDDFNIVFYRATWQNGQ